MTESAKSENASAAEPSELAVVTVSSRISDFWRDQPGLWFLHTEAILAPQKLSDEHRFNLIVSKLPKDVIQQVSDLLRDPPASKKFEALKLRLISTYEESEAKQFEKLLSQMDLGEQKPSQLLRRMRELAHDKINDDTLSMLWMRHLPASVRAVLAVADTQKLDTRAAMADKILETMRPVDVAEISTAASTSSDVRQEIARLTAQVAQLQLQCSQRSRFNQARGRPRFFRGRSLSRRRDESTAQHSATKVCPERTARDQSDRTCFYHARFGARANKCVQPCKYHVPGN